MTSVGLNLRLVMQITEPKKDPGVQDDNGLYLACVVACVIRFMLRKEAEIVRWQHCDDAIATAR